MGDHRGCLALASSGIQCLSHCSHWLFRSVNVERLPCSPRLGGLQADFQMEQTVYIYIYKRSNLIISGFDDKQHVSEVTF